MEFLIQSSSPACADEAATARRRPDWIRRKISLSDLCVSAVKLIFADRIREEGPQRCDSALTFALNFIVHRFFCSLSIVHSSSFKGG